MENVHNVFMVFMRQAVVTLHKLTAALLGQPPAQESSFAPKSKNHDQIPSLLTNLLLLLRASYDILCAASISHARRTRCAHIVAVASSTIDCTSPQSASTSSSLLLDVFNFWTSLVTKTSCVSVEDISRTELLVTLSTFSSLFLRNQPRTSP